MALFNMILSIDDFANNVGQFVRDGIRLIDEALQNGLGTTLVEMLIQLSATLIIFLIVRFLIWNKVTEILDKRKQVVRDAINERDKAIEEAKSVNLEAEQNRKAAKEDALRIVENAKKRGYNEAEAIISKANEDASIKINNAKEEIERMRAESEEDIKKEIVEVAYAMAEKIVDKEIKRDNKDINLDEFLKKGNK